MRLIAFGATDTGRRRQQNQDSVFCQTWPGTKTPLGLYAVADGMGGQSAGEIASQITIDTIREELSSFLQSSIGLAPKDGAEVTTGRLDEHGLVSEAPSVTMVDALAAAIQKSNQRIREHGQNYPETAGLGSTLTIVMVTGDLALIGNIGDSRTYLVRAGAISTLTQDHSLVHTLLQRGLISQEDVYSHPHRNLIYRALGTGSEANPDISMHRLQAGDTLVLCSDGLWEMVRDDDILSVVQNVAEPGEAAEQLVAMANANGGVDNISVVIVRVI